MNKKENIFDELQDFPILKGMKKKNEGYKVPKNYFSGLDEIIMEKVANEKKKTNFIIKILYSKYSLVAASFLVLAMALIYFGNDTAGTGTDFAISDDEATEYILENIDDFDDELLSTLMIPDEDLELQLNDEDLNNFLNELDDEDLENIL